VNIHIWWTWTKCERNNILPIVLIYTSGGTHILFWHIWESLQQGFFLLHFIPVSAHLHFFIFLNLYFPFFTHIYIVHTLEPSQSESFLHLHFSIILHLHFPFFEHLSLVHVSLRSQSESSAQPFDPVVGIELCVQLGLTQRGSASFHLFLIEFQAFSLNWQIISPLSLQMI